MKDKQHKYIVFEGIDGSGKTTIVGQLCSVLRGFGYSVLCIAEPLDKFIHVTGDLSFDAYRFYKDRLRLFEEHDFGDYNFIISDRSFYSSLAYQGVNDRVRGWIHELNSVFPEPFILFYLDIDPYQSLVRRDGVVDEEKVDYLQGVAERYGLVLPDGCVRIDVMNDDVLEKVLHTIFPLDHFCLE